MMEVLAAIFSAAGVWLTAQRNLLGWPVSLLATGLYGWVFFHARLYADTALQGVFSLAILYGWALWAREAQHNPQHASLWRWLGRMGIPSPCKNTSQGNTYRSSTPPKSGPGMPLFQSAANDNRPAFLPPAESLPARPLPPVRAMLETLVFLLLSIFWVEALRRWSDDPTPLLDGALSGASLLAQLWTARRHRISWLLWAGIDAIYTGLFLNRALSITALLYSGYALLGLYGYWKWRR